MISTNDPFSSTPNFYHISPSLCLPDYPLHPILFTGNGGSHKVGTKFHLEFSAKSGDGMHEVFLYATEAALLFRQKWMSTAHAHHFIISIMTCCVGWIEGTGIGSPPQIKFLWL